MPTDTNKQPLPVEVFNLQQQVNLCHQVRSLKVSILLQKDKLSLDVIQFLFTELVDLANNLVPQSGSNDV